MLDSSYRVPSEDKECYNLLLPIDSNWKQSKNRLLIVIQHVDRRDLKAKALFGDKDTLTLFKNCWKYSKELARRYDADTSEYAVAAINFHDKRHLHLSTGLRKSAEQGFAARVNEAIQKLKPTHILVSGDTAFTTLFPDIKDHLYKRGWVYNLKHNGLKVKVASTLDLATLVDQEGKKANLLGFWCRHTANLLIGKLPHGLEHVRSTPRYVDTIEKFDKMMTILYKSKYVACDTETKNLSVLNNKIYIIQFATEIDPTKGYVLPLWHPQSPFDKAELKYIKKKLRAYLMLRPGQKGAPEYMIFMNGMFDLRIIRRQFKIVILWFRVWEVTAGEHLLDENIGEMNAFYPKGGGKGPGGLLSIFSSYGNSYYLDAEFGKEERGSIGALPPDHPGVQAYCSMDVVSILHISESQKARSAYEEINGKSYKPYFLRHMLYQMSDTAHQLSHLREDGSTIDLKYLRKLIGKESPLLIEAAKLRAVLKAKPECIDANERLLEDAGVKSVGLFGSSNTSRWILSFTKSKHLKKLFFDVMGLEPVNYTKTEEPSVDKAFIAEHRTREPLIDDYGNLVGIYKLISTYAKGWYKRLATNLDSLQDFALRAEFVFFNVVTGRLASRSPNFQNIPSRGKLAKIIKEMFVAPKGYILIRYDYSAHEVRIWSVISNDTILANAFKIGQRLRQQFIKTPTEALAKKIKLEGDIHIINVLRFFSVQVDKEHPLRDAVKAVVFGVLYGKSAETLGTDTKKAEHDALKEKLYDLYEELRNCEKE